MHLATLGRPALITARPGRLRGPGFLPWDPLAAMALGVQAALVLWHVGLVLVGPDQARDLSVVLNLAEGREYPLLGPMFHAAFRTGPAFYYVAALPVWLTGSVQALYALFALVHVAAAVVAWWAVRRFHGTLTGALYAAFGLPAWVVLYMHSGWNPTLVLPLANLLLAAFLAGMHRGGAAWVLVGVIGALLLQVHLSAAPVLVAVLPLAMLYRWQDRQWIALGLVAALVLFTPWFVHESTAGFPYLKAFLNPRSAESGHFAAHLADASKWADLATLLPRFLAGLEGIPEWLAALGGVQTRALAVGALLALFVVPGAVRMWAVAVVGTWLVLSMGYLASGFVYYVDVLFPWLAWFAALGLTWLVRRLGRWSGAIVIGALAAASLLPAAVVKLAWAQDGILVTRLGSLRFPDLPPEQNPVWPFLSEPLVQWYYTELAERGVPPERVAGAAAVLVRESSNRWHQDRFRLGRPPSSEVLLLVGPLFERHPPSPALARRGAFVLYDAGALPASARVDFFAPRRPDDLHFGTEFSPGWHPEGPVELPVRCRPGGRFTLALRCLPRVDGRLPFRIQTQQGRGIEPRHERWTFMLLQDFGELDYACPDTPQDVVVLQPTPARAACDVNVTPNLTGPAVHE